jgi:ketosteroid isomerase-like protein
MTESERIVLRAFEAVDTRDEILFESVKHPQATFVWPESLRADHFKTADGREAVSYEDVWEPFQPRARFPTRRMDAQIVASSGERVVVLWHQRGVNTSGEELDVEVLGLYDVRDGLLYRTQMFYFDGVATRRFLDSGFASRAKMR